MDFSWVDSCLLQILRSLALSAILYLMQDSPFWKVKVQLESLHGKLSWYLKADVWKSTKMDLSCAVPGTYRMLLSCLLCRSALWWSTLMQRAKWYSVSVISLQKAVRNILKMFISLNASLSSPSLGFLGMGMSGHRVWSHTFLGLKPTPPIFEFIQNAHYL